MSCTPRLGIAGSLGNFMFNLSRNCQLSSAAFKPSHQQGTRFIIHLQRWQDAIFHLLDFRYPSVCEWCFTVVLVCIFITTMMLNTFSYTCWSFVYFIWKNVYLSSFWSFCCLFWPFEISGCHFLIELYELFFCSDYQTDP